MRNLVSGLALLALAGCVSPAERHAATCSSYGIARGSDHFADCMQKEAAIEAQAQRDRAADMIVGLALLSSMQGPSRLPAGAYTLSSPMTTCWQAGYYWQCQ